MRKINKFEELFESFDGEAMYNSGVVTSNQYRTYVKNFTNPAIELEEEPNHTFKDLERILLDKDGDKVIEVFEEDLEELINKAIFYDPIEYSYKIFNMPQSQCHSNSVSFYKNFIKDSDNSEDEISIVTGWALSDGTWVQHSWVMLPYDDVIIETTSIKRDLYYGIFLNGDELYKFIEENN